MIQVPALAADPVPTNTTEAKALVEKLTAEQREAERQYNELNDAVTSASGLMDERSAAIQKQTTKVNKMRTSIGALALTRYQNRGKETTEALVSADTTTALRKLATVDHMDTALNSTLQSLQSENGYLSELSAKQTADSAQAVKDRDKLKDLDDKAKDRLARAEGTLKMLSDADRKAFLDEQARRDAAAEQSRSYTARSKTAVEPEPAKAAPAQTTATGLQSSRNARGNMYDWGSCVWYAYNARAAMGAPVSSSWGSAASWPNGALAEGFVVNHVPSVGSVFISPPGVNGASGMGHAGMVTGVNPDGSISTAEMNHPAPGVVTTHSYSAAAAAANYYIH